jgi:hypothetical protein
MVAVPYSPCAPAFLKTADIKAAGSPNIPTYRGRSSRQLAGEDWGRNWLHHFCLHLRSGRLVNFKAHNLTRPTGSGDRIGRRSCQQATIAPASHSRLRCHNFRPEVLSWLSSFWTPPSIRADAARSHQKSCCERLLWSWVNFWLEMFRQLLSGRLSSRFIRQSISKPVGASTPGLGPHGSSPFQSAQEFDGHSQEQTSVFLKIRTFGFAARHRHFGPTSRDSCLQTRPIVTLAGKSMLR